MIVFIIMSSYLFYFWHFTIKPNLPEEQIYFTIHISVIYIVLGIIGICSSLIGIFIASEKESGSGIIINIICFFGGIIILIIGLSQYKMI